MNVCEVTFGGYLAKILSFKTGNLLNNSKFHLLSEGTVQNCVSVTVPNIPSAPLLERKEMGDARSDEIL